MARELAMDSDGNLSWCSVPPESRGTKGCHHIGHKESGESTADFIQRTENLVEEQQEIEDSLDFDEDLGSDRIDDPERSPDDSDEIWKAKLDFTRDVKSYGVDKAKENLGADHVETLRVELSNIYGAQDEDTQNRVITAMSMALDDKKSPLKLSDGRNLSYYYAEFVESSVMVPNASSKLANDLRDYMENTSKKKTL